MCLSEINCRHIEKLERLLAPECVLWTDGVALLRIQYIHSTATAMGFERSELPVKLNWHSLTHTQFHKLNICHHIVQDCWINVWKKPPLLHSRTIILFLNFDQWKEIFIIYKTRITCIHAWFPNFNRYLSAVKIPNQNFLPLFTFFCSFMKNTRDISFFIKT